MLMMEER
jgi:putative transposase